MKYKAIIETDDYEDFEFFEDGNGKYLHGIDAGAVNGEWILLYFTECKQEPVLDKIRAEIIELRSRQNVGVLECLDIIDKYRAESEDVDANEENHNKCSFCIHCEMCGWTEKYKNCGCECFDNGEEVLKQMQEGED